MARAPRPAGGAGAGEEVLLLLAWSLRHLAFSRSCPARSPTAYGKIISPASSIGKHRSATASSSASNPAKYSQLGCRRTSQTARSGSPSPSRERHDCTLTRAAFDKVSAGMLRFAFYLCQAESGTATKTLPSTSTTAMTLHA